MKFQHEVTYDATTEDTYAMLADPAYRQRVCAAQQGSSCKVSVEPADDGMSVTVEQSRSTVDLPSFAKKVVGDQVTIRQEEKWNGPEQARLDVSIPGKPVRLTGTLNLEARRSGSAKVVEGDLKVSIPMVGGKLEKSIADVLHAALDGEQKVASRWLEGER